jgi:sigma-E factor negative regulatory protein RseA
MAGNAMDTQKRLHENISALVDGELPDSEGELALAALGTAEGQVAWRAYHLIGDVLRNTPGAEPGARFEAALAQRLAAEPPHAPAASPESAGEAAATPRQDQAESPADVILP